MSIIAEMEGRLPLTPPPTTRSTCIGYDEARDELRRLVPEIRDDLAHANKLTLGRLRNEYRAGHLLNEIERNRGGRPSKNGRDRDRLLADLGITKTESYRWRLLAAIPKAVFDAELQRLEEAAER